MVREGQHFILPQHSTINCATLLIDYGADLNKLDSDARTPLHHCALGLGNSAEVLVGRGASMEQADALGQTVFHLAASRNNVKVLRVLLNNPAFDQNFLSQRCLEGLTPLLYAGSAKSQDAFALLIDYTDDLTPHVDDEGMGLAHYAACFEPRILEIILRRGFEIRTNDSKRLTPLHYCCKENCNRSLAKNIELLLKFGADPDLVDDKGDTALHLLLDRNGEYGLDWENIESPIPLLATSNNISLKSNDGWTGFNNLLCFWNPYNKSEIAAKDLLDRGVDYTIVSSPYNRSCFDLLLGSQELGEMEDSRFQGSISALITDILDRPHISRSFLETEVAKGRIISWAAKASQNTLLQRLLEHATDIDIEVLQDIFQQNVSPAVTQTLLSHHTDQKKLFTLHSKYGETLVHTVCNGRSEASVVILGIFLAAGADPNGHLEPEMITCLMLTAKNGKKEHARLLLEHNAAIDVLNSRGLSAIHLATLCGRRDILELFTIANIQAQFRSEARFEASRCGDCAVRLHKPSLLHLAYRSPPVLEYLLREVPGIDLHCQDEYGRTVLELAALAGEFKSVETLISNNANVGYVTPEGMSALHYAAFSTYNGSTHVVNLLLKAGDDLNIKGINGGTPLHLAASRGKDDVVSTLIEHGARFDSDRSGYTPEMCAMANSHNKTSQIIRQYMEYSKGWY